MEYKFDQIAFNSTAKKMPEDSDRQHYIGLEHLDTNCLYVSRWGSDVTPIGEKLLMKKGDVLFGKRRAYQRKVGIAPFDGIFSAHGMVLRPKEKIMDKDFFPFFISSDQFMERAVRISVGGLSPTINWKDLKEQVFDIPSIEEQKTLAAKLWAAYRLREEYKRLLTATDEMVKSRFISQFERPDYLVYSFDEICYDDTKSATKIPASEYSKQGLYPIFDQATDSVIAGYTNDSNGINNDYPAVLFGDHSRVVKLIDRAFFIGADGVKVLRPVNAGLSTEFLYYQIKFKTIPNTGYNRHFKYLKDHSYCVPRKNEQDAFLAMCHQADKSKFELKQAIEKIDKVMRSLLQ